MSEEKKTQELEQLGITEDEIIKQEEPPEAIIETASVEFLTLPDEKTRKQRELQVKQAFEYLRFIKSLVLEELTPAHFINYDGKPYLTADGAEKFRAPLGIGIKDLRAWIIKTDGTQVNIEDKNAFVGDIKAVRFEGIFYSKVLGVEAYINGGSSVNESFKDKDDVIFWVKKAQRNFYSYGIKLLLGLNNLDWSELAKFNIKEENVKKIEYVKTEKITYEQAQEIWNLILSKFNGDENQAKQYLKNTTGKNSPQNLTARQYEYLKAQFKKSDWLDNAKIHAQNLSEEQLSKILNAYGVKSLEEADKKLDTKSKNSLLQQIVKSKP